MQKRLIKNIIFTVGLAIFIQNSKANSDTELKNSNWVIKVVSKAKCDDCVSGFTHLVSFTNLETDDVYEINGFEDVIKINNLSVYQDILVLKGDLPYGGTVVALVDINTRKQKDKFYGYDVNSSPTGRYIFFQKFVPRFRLGTKTKDIAYLYDLKKAPNDNREYGISSTEKIEVGRELISQKVVNDDKAGISYLYREVYWGKNEDSLYIFVSDEEGYLSIVGISDLSKVPQRNCKKRLIKRFIEDSENVDKSLKYTISSISFQDTGRSTLLVNFFAQYAAELNMKLHISSICE